jgi:hypothetical protein
VRINAYAVRISYVSGDATRPTHNPPDPPVWCVVAYTIGTPPNGTRPFPRPDAPSVHART